MSLSAIFASHGLAQLAVVSDLQDIRSRVAAANASIAILTEIAEDTVEQGQTLIAKGQAGGSQLLSEAHTIYLQLGETKTARQIMIGLAAEGEDAGWKAYAAIRAGDLCPPELRQEATEWYEKAISIIDDQGPQWLTGKNEGTSLRLALIGAARTNLSAGDCKKAVDLFSRLDSQTGLGRTTQEHAFDKFELGRAQWKCGEDATADFVYRQGIDLLKASGTDNGEILTFELEYSRRGKLDIQVSTDRFAHLLSLFHDQTYRSVPEFAFVINALAANKFSTDQLYLTWSRELVAMIETWQTTLVTAPAAKAAEAKVALVGTLFTVIDAVPTTACDVRIALASHFIAWFPDRAADVTIMEQRLAQCGVIVNP
jgi:tetratricopeptide (TPR) repeat protein